MLILWYMYCNSYSFFLKIYFKLYFLYIKVNKVEEDNENKEVTTKILNLQSSPPSSITSEISTCTKSPMIHTGKGMRMEGQRDLQSSTFSISCE